MEFWGVEVKAGEPLKVVPEESSVIHLSQATLAELKKGGDQCAIHVKVGNQKLVLANLSSDKMPQIPFDLVFDKEFELSHSLKSGSVHFCGYQSCLADSAATESDEEDQSVFTDSEEGPLLNFTDNGNDVAAKPAPPKTNAVKPESSGKQKVNIVEPIKDEDDSDDSDDIDGSSDDDDDTSSDEDMLGADSSDEDDDDSEEEEDTPTPKKNPKKRPNESAPKTPVSAKKAKQVTPQKTDGKKGAHTATPHPAKKGGKTPATSDKSKPQTPKSAGGDHSCKPCNKSFNSDGALSSHKKAKHSAK